MSTQLITPNPDIAAEEGMCLQYVRQTFGLPARYASATEAWNNSPSQHTDRNYPQGVWFPVWWGLDKNVNGHVALVAPSGRVYSTSDLDPSPLHVHVSVADVEAYYAHYGMTLSYRGWTEDVAGTPVISLDGTISYEGTITTQEEDVANTDLSLQENSLKVLTDNKTINGSLSVTEALEQILSQVQGIPDQVLFGKRVDGRNIVDTGRQGLANDAAILAALSGIKAGNSITAADIAAAVPTGIAQAVADELAKRLSGGVA